MNLFSQQADYHPKLNQNAVNSKEEGIGSVCQKRVFSAKTKVTTDICEGKIRGLIHKNIQ